MVTETRIMRNRQWQRQRQKYWTVLGLLLAIGIILVGLVGWRMVHQREVRQALLQKYPVRGLELDQTSAYVDFNQAARHGVKYVYLRATQGGTLTDDDFSNNYERSLGSGMQIGVYHQYSFTANIRDQEQNLIKTIGKKRGSLPLMINIAYYDNYTAANVNRQELRRRVEQFTQDLFHRYQRPVIIQTEAENYRALRGIAHTEFCGELGKSSHPARFVTLPDNQQYYPDGAASGYRMTAFLGNKLQWKHYAQKLPQVE
ncbi:GH25 family lysozyme [Fructilactobacillus florum]|uniref:Glycoside hydrolase family 25 n=1 Tax=Fructilactobacillus florum DSM 22689 = JCM 16035 TaxID=1423745 RepID=A0A0R2CSB2_9LACO|nr:GH25 family lysozyme [Fructilactobacillus florum]EKK20072.1 lysozyme (putative) [Fructilactobacillus florum 2F]KRM91163.1 glycoside hydrolase family 25 [Fructilactobacillus florum DSM 22689 = JCM 16035]